MEHREEKSQRKTISAGRSIDLKHSRADRYRTVGRSGLASVPQHARSPDRRSDFHPLTISLFSSNCASSFSLPRPPPWPPQACSTLPLAQLSCAACVRRCGRAAGGGAVPISGTMPLHCSSTAQSSGRAQYGVRHIASVHACGYNRIAVSAPLLLLHLSKLELAELFDAHRRQRVPCRQPLRRIGC